MNNKEKKIYIFLWSFWGSSLENTVSNLLFTRTAQWTPAPPQRDSPLINILHLSPLCPFPFLLPARCMRDPTCLTSFPDMILCHGTCSKQGHFLKHHCIPIQDHQPIHRLHPNFQLSQQYLFFPFWSSTRLALSCHVSGASVFFRYGSSFFPLSHLRQS